MIWRSDSHTKKPFLLVIVEFSLGFDVQKYIKSVKRYNETFEHFVS